MTSDREQHWEDGTNSSTCRLEKKKILQVVDLKRGECEWNENRNEYKWKWLFKSLQFLRFNKKIVCVFEGEFAFPSRRWTRGLFNQWSRNRSGTWRRKENHISNLLLLIFPLPYPSSTSFYTYCQHYPGTLIHLLRLRLALFRPPTSAVRIEWKMAINLCGTFIWRKFIDFCIIKFNEFLLLI